jgi:hypothetical protein
VEAKEAGCWLKIGDRDVRENVGAPTHVQVIAESRCAAMSYNPAHKFIPIP